MQKKTELKKGAGKKHYETDEVKRYLGVLSKQHHHEINAVSEQLGGITQRLDSNEDTLVSHGAMLRSQGIALESQSKILESHSKALESQSKILETLSKKVDSHTEMLGHVMTDIQEIKNGLTAKVDRTEFSRLEKRVIALERARASAK
jgi:hypothetical protein